jgi:hypothetical protein
MKIDRMAGCAALLLVTTTLGGAAETRPSVSREALATELDTFLGTELGAHLGAIPRLDPPPERVFGALTTGEFTWGSFMRALGEYQKLSGRKQLADRDLAKWVGQMGLIEARGAGKAFAQLYSALALRTFGTDLKTNAAWQSLTPEEQQAWRSLLDPARFYDAKEKKVIQLPENYLGVAARILAMSHEMGISPDRGALDALLDRAAAQFVAGEIYADDQPPVGRFDRYSNEYARYVWLAASIAGRQDILDKVRPSLKTQMILWWDIVSEDGYGFPWGRSLGLVSYLDTMEIVGFLAENPEFRPAPMPELAAVFHAAWRWLRHDYNDKTHMFSVYDFGRGNYQYISREREWQQTGTAFGKIANASQGFLNGTRAEKLDAFPDRPSLGRVARWVWFRQGDRPKGVWVVRQGALRFSLPVTAGTFPGVADYLPAPHGLQGFAAPVERPYPSLVPYVELADGRTVTAGEGADVIEPGADGQSLRLRSRRLALPPAARVNDAKAVELGETGLETDVRFRIDGGRLVREETLLATRSVRVKHWKVAVPSRYAEYRREERRGETVHVFSGPEGELRVVVSGPVETSVLATGDTPLGRSDRGALPLHLVLTRHDFEVSSASPFRWTIALEPRAATAAGPDAR